jgi:hypothetical protein
VAAQEKILDVTWFGQEKLYYCGPAVAQMFLNYVKVTVSQDDLWTDVTNNTNGVRPADAPPSDHDFPEQVCDNCETNDANPPIWECWDTTPEALRVTIGIRGGGSLAAEYAPTFDKGAEKLIESLDRSPGVPAFATIHLINHWVLVNGYLRDDEASVEAPAQDVGKYRLNGFYILDPQELDPVERIRLVTVREWHSEFGLIGCGPHVDTYPVVVGSGLIPGWLYTAIVMSILFAIIWLIARWWLGG